MFFSNLVILGGGLLMATTGVEARAIGKLSFLPHLPFSTTSTSSSSPPPTLPSSPSASQQTCAFTPHIPLRTTQSAFSIPASAWPLLRTLLTTHIIPQAAFSPPTPSSAQLDAVAAEQQQKPPPEKLILHNSVQTLHLRDFTDDASLEGLVLGLVFSTGDPDASEKELRSVSVPETVNDNDREAAVEMRKRKRGVVEGQGERERRGCIEEAVRRVEEGRVMEGVLELDGRGGTVGFLVYRVD
ncbi:hypothetical protein BKA64DRAFT_775900 [Cadophora sp. MPI-SDFR-AT-0126]|nr:hypothetical protein BKA64DRAFT_775900 [Leotiomycetes sp. MPI-SDFR-AT-0126]